MLVKVELLAIGICHTISVLLWLLCPAALVLTDRAATRAQRRQPTGWACKAERGLRIAYVRAGDVPRRSQRARQRFDIEQPGNRCSREDPDFVATMAGIRAALEVAS